MSIGTALKFLATAAILAVLAGAGVVTYDTWRPWVLPGKADDTAKKAEAPHEDHEVVERVKLSKQARANLKLVVEPVQPTTYWRKIPIPATVAERPGKSDRGVTAPVAGVILRVNATPGKVVRPGEELFKLRLLSESLQTSQTELYKTVLEEGFNQQEYKRLTDPKVAGSVPGGRLIELEYQKERLKATRQALRQDLLARRLTEDQIKGVEKGVYVTELTISVPVSPVADGPLTGKDKQAPESQGGKVTEYEVQELKVNLGDSVQVGQTLALLSDHRALFLEGRALKQESGRLTQAFRGGWPVEVEFAEEATDAWPEFQDKLKIEFLGGVMDPGGLTFPFYVLLKNQQRQHTLDEEAVRVWRFRPGQRALLKVAVEKLDNVFVLPLEAVVREGPEAYVFRQNGEAFDRTQVHVRYEGTDHVAIANDGSLTPGNYVAHNGASALNRVLKAAAGGPADPHAGHNH